MTELTMRERVTRAIGDRYETAMQRGHLRTARLPHEVCALLAEAAIVEMRKPTEAMISTSDAADDCNFGEGMGAEEHWRTMIDAALAESLR